ncbi:hypothetical protein ACFS7Z_13785 [Pontibacter toksunensis]|uniref:Uncharacterized protein n=1 Tax=Pontibacter toksunensis TaxID=1332631 RepID=A0ABW6BWI2_9BACT
MNGRKNQTVTVVLPAGTPAGVHEVTEILDTQYQQCVGVAVYETSNGGVPNYKIGLRDDTQTYQMNTHRDDWVSSTDVAPDERYKSLDLPVNGSRLTIRTQLQAALTSELSYDIVFRLIGKK